jgi:hypothetical protein
MPENKTAVAEPAADARYYSDCTENERISEIDRYYKYWNSYFQSRARRHSWAYRPYWTVGLPILFSGSLIVVARQLGVIDVSTSRIFAAVIGAVTLVAVFLVFRSDEYSDLVEEATLDKLADLRSQLGSQVMDRVIVQNVRSAVFSKSATSAEEANEILKYLRNLVESATPPRQTKWDFMKEKTRGRS